MKMISLFILCLLTNKVYGSYPELFGASFSTSAIGNQANSNINDPSNNYYVPALLGFSDKFNVLAQATSTAVYFKSINNIVVTNGTNSNTSTPTYGSASINYPKFYGSTLHAAVPLGGNRHLGTLGFSIFLPVGKIIQTHSGHPFLPEYVMYRSRHQRTSTYVNLAKKWDDGLSWSIGAIMGFQTSAEVNTNMSLNGSSYGSWGKQQAEVSPSIGAILSLAKKFDRSLAYFTYQQEMKSNLKASVTGEITNPSTGIFDSTIESMIFYDPHIFRLGATKTFGSFEFFTALEYQMWSSYKTGVVRMKKNGGVVADSSNFEKVTTRDTINPRLGVTYHFTDRFNASLGAQYRQTPLEGDFSGAGNSVDVNTLVGAVGAQYRLTLWDKDVHVGGAFQYHSLESKNVVKSANQEDGTAGDKLGAPGYELGGHIIAGSVGVKFNF